MNSSALGPPLFASRSANELFRTRTSSVRKSAVCPSLPHKALSEPKVLQPLLDLLLMHTEHFDGLATPLAYACINPTETLYFSSKMFCIAKDMANTSYFQTFLCGVHIDRQIARRSPLYQKRQWLGVHILSSPELRFDHAAHSDSHTWNLPQEPSPSAKSAATASFACSEHPPECHPSCLSVA